MEVESMLTPFVSKYGERQEGEPNRLDKALLIQRKRGGFDMLRDLHDLWLLVNESMMSLNVLEQAARALRDQQLLDVLKHMQKPRARLVPLRLWLPFSRVLDCRSRMPLDLSRLRARAAHAVSPRQPLPSDARVHAGSALYRTPVQLAAPPSRSILLRDEGLLDFGVRFPGLPFAAFRDRCVGRLACSLKGPFDPTGCLRTTPGFDIVAATTSGSSTCFATP
jgi:hypothetical protein